MTRQEQLNYFAAHALQALIAKLPLLDREGVYGVSKTQEEIEQVKSELAETAWNYGQWMLYHQEKAYKWIDENFPQPEPHE